MSIVNTHVIDSEYEPLVLVTKFDSKYEPEEDGSRPWAQIDARVALSQGDHAFQFNLDSFGDPTTPDWGGDVVRQMNSIDLTIEALKALRYRIEEAKKQILAEIEG